MGVVWLAAPLCLEKIDCTLGLCFSVYEFLDKEKGSSERGGIIFVWALGEHGGSPLRGTFVIAKGLDAMIHRILL